MTDTCIVEQPPTVVINVEQIPTILINVEQIPTTVVESQVLPGPPGPSGGGGGVGSFEYAQNTPAAVWTVNHNLGYRPAVTVLSTGGVAMVAEVIHASTNQALVYFDQPVAGLAICS